jgi:AcrR family transcriptional regulator
MDQARARKRGGSQHRLEGGSLAPLLWDVAVPLGSMATSDLPDMQPLTAKGRATRERIVQSAAEVILAEGISGLNLKKVREVASVSGSQLTHYFVDKQALIRAVISRQMEVVLDFHRQPKLGRLDSFDDYEEWIAANLRYLRRIGYEGTPTYHALAGALAKSDEATRKTLAAGYWQWIELIEQSIQRMKDRGVIATRAEPRQLAMVIVASHQGGANMTFTYRQEWPLMDALRFAVNYLRMFATDPAERAARHPRRTRDRRKFQREPGGEQDPLRFTPKGLDKRARIVDRAAQLMFERGVARTSLADVRSAAGVGGSQLSHYFADKRDLTREVIASRTNDVITFHTQPRLGDLDSPAALRGWADACVAEADSVYLRGGCIYGSLTGELLEADEEVLDDLAVGYERWLALFRRGLSTMRGRGRLTAEASPRHLAAALVAAHQGGTLLTYATGSPEPLRAVLNAAVDYVNSFRPAPNRRSLRPTSRPRKKS